LAPAGGTAGADAGWRRRDKSTLKPDDKDI
jgi:hypothetical protein